MLLPKPMLEHFTLTISHLSLHTYLSSAFRVVFDRTKDMGELHSQICFLAAAIEYVDSQDLEAIGKAYVTLEKEPDEKHFASSITWSLESGITEHICVPKH